MAYFNFNLTDLATGKTFNTSILENQKNYTPTGEAKNIVTSESKEPEKKKSLTTATVSDILQNQLTIKDQGLVATQFNEVMSSDMARLINMKVSGVDTKLTRPQAYLLGYDIPNTSIGTGTILSNTVGTNSGSISENPNAPSPIPESGTVIDFAKSRLGCGYVWGASGPNTFDCSGLVLWAFAKVSITLPHYSGAQYGATERISETQLVPGDLIFWGSDASEHVSIFMGDDKMIHAFGTQVQISQFKGWWKAPFGFGRVKR